MTQRKQLIQALTTGNLQIVQTLLNHRCAVWIKTGNTYENPVTKALVLEQDFESHLTENNIIICICLPNNDRQHY